MASPLPRPPSLVGGARSLGLCVGRLILFLERFPNLCPRHKGRLVLETSELSRPPTLTLLRPRGRGSRLCWSSLRGPPNTHKSVSPTPSPAPATPPPRHPSPEAPQRSLHLALPTSLSYCRSATEVRRETRRHEKLRGLGQKQRTEREKDRALGPQCPPGRMGVASASWPTT